MTDDSRPQATVVGQPSSVALEWERVPPNCYRSVDGRFTISRVNLGRCAGVRWILVDNRSKSQTRHWTLASAQLEADNALGYEAYTSGELFYPTDGGKR
jgi:hypothetical protein